MKKQKVLVSKTGSDFGILGTPVDYLDLKVGDVVSFVFNRRNFTKIIAQDEDGHAFVMGWGTASISSILQNGFTISIPHHLLNDELLNYTESWFTIEEREEPPVKMTLEQLEEMVGHRIEII